MHPGRLRARALAPFAAALAIAAAGAWWFLAAMRERTGGAWCAPVDDAFIYLQYARRLAEGHGLAYSDGNAPSTGASSLLYTAMLVPGWWLGVRGQAFLLVGVAIGTVALAAAVVLSARLAGDLAPAEGKRAARALAAVLTGLCGPLLWAAYSGMDSLVFAACLVGALALLARRGAAPGPAWLAFGALAFARPEGTMLGLAAILVLAAPSGRAGARWALASLALLAAPLALNAALTGAPLGDSTTLKSGALYLPPDAPLAVLPAAIAALIPTFAENARTVALSFLTDFREASPDRAQAWTLLFLVGAGLAVALVRGLAGRHGAAGRVLAVWILLAVAFPATSPLWSSQYYRYISPYAPLVAAACAAGWATILGALASRSARLAVGAGVVVACAALLAGGVAQARTAFGGDCEMMAHIQQRAAIWIAEHAAPAERVALDDAGAIAFFGERPTLDLVGLTTPGWVKTVRHGEAALFERLRSLPPAERPALLAALPAWIQGVAATRFAGEPIFRARSDQWTEAMRLEKYVWRLDWSALALGAEPVSTAAREAVTGRELVDALNVAERASEIAHEYAARSPNPSIVLELPAEAPGRPLVIDGGRAVTWESMRLRTRAGRDALLVLRVRVAKETAVELLVDGASVARAVLPAAPEIWSEPRIAIPADRLRGDAATIELRVDGEIALSVFHHWLFQSAR